MSQLNEATKGENFNLIPRMATAGAICFRAGRIQEGRRRYLEAIEESRGPDLAKVKMMAMMHLALEEVRVRSAEALSSVKLALEAADNRPYLMLWFCGPAFATPSLEMQSRS